jgi:hypothetical protein
LVLLPCFLFSQVTKNTQENINPKSNVPITSLGPGAVTQAPSSDGGSYSVLLPAGNTESVYFPDEWTMGTAHLSDGSVIEDMNLRYNMYSQQMQFIKDNDTAAFARPEEIASLSIGDHQFIYTSFNAEKELKDGYFEVLTHGKCQLLLRREITYHLVDDLDDGVINDSYILEKTYYIEREDKPASRISLNKKAVISAFCEKQNQVEKYIKKNKIRFKTQEDMVRVVDYYNSL